MAFSGSELLSLQANIKKDSEGYRDEFLLQYRHYRACLDIFNLQPANDSREFGDLVLFLAQVCRSYPADTAGFVTELMALLEKHYAVLNPSLRKTLVQALILMRNRHQVEGAVLLPLFFTLFRCQDKALRELLFRHIVADIRNSNLKSRNDKLNRSVQNFLYGILQDDNEQAAKRSLAVLTELWRRHVWRDARTVNVIASAAFHKRSVVMLAVVKFFLGQDDKNEDGEGSDDDKDDGDKDNNVAGPSKEDVYKAYKKGTLSSKKKKQAKLKRVMATVKKQTKRAEDKTNESFAAVHLLHDPQSFVERLFSRMQV